tara:strand:+ start:20 stop:457 length:438 start_codon:yes stop_codon:yes gene_type:complete
MPMTKEEKTIYYREYKIKNRERLLQQRKEYQQLNREKISQQNKEYSQLNKERLLQKKREYQQTEVGHKTYRISHWKYQGMILRDGDDWESVYYYYMTTDECEQCNKVFKNSLNRHLDHCHTSKFIRDVVCCSCNRLRSFEDAKSK